MTRPKLTTAEKRAEWGDAVLVTCEYCGALPHKWCNVPGAALRSPHAPLHHVARYLKARELAAYRKDGQAELLNRDRVARVAQMMRELDKR